MATTGEDKPLSSRDITRAPLLHARAANQCPVRTHLDIHPPAGTVEVPMDPIIQARVDAGRDFETDVMAALVAEHGPIPSFAGDPDGARTAMAEGLPLIAQAPLVDEVGRRTGRPDLLAASAGRTPDGAVIYVPVEIKSHLVSRSVEAEGDLPAVPLAEVGVVDLTEVPPDPTLTGRRHTGDLLTLAHYHRLLEAAGHAGEPVAAVIGSERLAAVWRLDQPMFQSWRNMTGRWTVMQKYEREFGFRLDVAVVAADRAAGVTDEPPLVVPARNGECPTCPWEGVCGPRMESADEVTLLPGISWRERVELRDQGITTGSQLAAEDPQDQRTKALSKAVDHARLRTAGIPVARRRGRDRLDLPRADVEVDVDMESSPSMAVYLWGNLVTVDGTSTYVPFVDFDLDLDADQLFSGFWTWLMDLRSQTHRAGRTFAAYCWSGAENRYLREYGPPRGVDVEPFIASSEWVDLERVVADHLITSVGRTGLKAIAPLTGFAWRDGDPGGAQSMLWYQEAVAGDVAMQQRLLDYNTDDVRATLAVRDWLAAAWPDLPAMEDLTGG